MIAATAKSPTGEPALIVTDTERKNGWTGPTLTKYLRNHLGEQEFARELWLRARDCERAAQDALERFRRSDEDLEAAPGKRQLKALEKAIADAKAVTALAADQLDKAWPELNRPKG